MRVHERQRKRVDNHKGSLARAHLVLGEHAALPLRGEGVKHQIQGQQHHAARYAAPPFLLPEHIRAELDSL